jgi:hypothetical protein
MSVRRWDRIVAVWAAGDDQEMDDAWVDQVVDLGAEWGQYEYVTNIGFAALEGRALDDERHHGRHQPGRGS